MPSEATIELNRPNPGGSYRGFQELTELANYNQLRTVTLVGGMLLFEGGTHRQSVPFDFIPNLAPGAAVNLKTDRITKVNIDELGSLQLISINLSLEKPNPVVTGPNYHLVEQNPNRGGLPLRYELPNGVPSVWGSWSQNDEPRGFSNLRNLRGQTNPFILLRIGQDLFIAPYPDPATGAITVKGV